MINKSGRTKNRRDENDGRRGDDGDDDDDSALSRSATGDGGNRPPSMVA